MRLKKGITLQGVRPELILGLCVISNIFKIFGNDMIITSLLDGQHSKNSLHYTGCAADLRTSHLGKETIEGIIDEMKDDLTNDFDVVLESDHIHIEYQPRYKE